MLAVRGEHALQRESMANGSTTSEKPKGLYMRLPARAENVAVVRHALAGLAEQIGMDETGVADLKTVVTEACMNVVVHAYPGESGPLTVEAEPDSEGLTVIVSDSGSGISPQAESERASLKLGLSLIAALSSSFSISGGLDRGTEVMMRLPLRERGGADSDGAAEKAPAPRWQAPRSRSAAPSCSSRYWRGWSAPLSLAAISPVDRVSDAVLITDAIAGAAPGRFADGRVRLGLGESTRDSSCVSGRWKTAPRAKSAGARRFPRSAARWRPSPTNSSSKSPRTAST